MGKLTPIEGAGRPEDRAQALLDVFREAIDEHAEGMSVATVIGTLHLLAHAIIEEYSDG
jgi:hypothetical protein